MSKFALANLAPVSSGWSRHAAGLLFVAALAWTGAVIPRPSPAQWLTAPAPGAQTLRPFMVATLLPAVAESAGSPSLAELPDGRIAAAWLAGPGEPSAAALWFSLRDAAGWRDPRRIVDVASAAGRRFAHLDALEQPQLEAGRGTLHLWFASRGFPGWTSPQPMHLMSMDEGESWGRLQRIAATPLGGEALQGSLPLGDGGRLLALAQARSIEWVRLDAALRVVGKQRLATGARQGAFVALPDGRLLGILRRPEASIVAISEDGGEHWQETPARGLANPQTASALLRLEDGRLLLAGNGEQGTDSLHLWLSADQGRHWRLARTLENAADGAASFSHPSLLQGQDGQLHLAYAWRGQRIKYLNFSPAWLDGGTA